MSTISLVANLRLACLLTHTTARFTHQQGLFSDHESPHHDHQIGEHDTNDTMIMMRFEFSVRKAHVYCMCVEAYVFYPFQTEFKIGAFRKRQEERNICGVLLID